MPKDTFFNFSLQKQEKIIRSAVSEFLEYGFEKGNISRIAKNAGVAVGSMYQYFENKKELFMYSVQWAADFFFKKFEKYNISEYADVFDYIEQSSRQMLLQIRDDKELAVFLQDILLGRFNSLTDGSVTAMQNASDEYVLAMIREGKKGGSIRKDIDDRLLSDYLTGAAMKIKENILKKAKSSGLEITDTGMEQYESDIKAMLELLRNGMGERNSGTK
jgi:AcrR family transcriptional regulator